MKNETSMSKGDGKEREKERDALRERERDEVRITRADKCMLAT